MSYSRWSNSTWYTYWACSRDGVPETYDNAIFEVCGIASFSAKDLRDDIESCLCVACSECEMEGVLTPFTPTKEEIQELREYMERFLADVDKKYLVTAEASE